jgi:manganese/zinc/iron transport system permease protein
MDPLKLFYDLFFDYTLRTVALGAGTLGIVSGALGSFAVLRKQSLLGDAMSHAALPGIVLAFLLTGSRTPLVLMLGAIAAGWIGTLLMMRIIQTTRIKIDSALGLVLSVFFGLGLMLLTFAQKRPDASQAGLKKYLFGQAATLLERDVITMAAFGLVALVMMLIFWKEFKLLSFDSDFAASLGWPVRWLDVLLTTLLVIAIVVGLQAVGVVLMSAMIVAPAAAARQWTDRLGLMVGLAALFGALAGVSGAVISSTATGLSTGPTIVLCASLIVLASFLLAPNRGLLWDWLRRQRNRRQLRLEAILSDLYTLALQHDNPAHGHSVAVLQTMSVRRGGVRRTLAELAERGWVRQLGFDKWALTPAGLVKAKQSFQLRQKEAEA